MILAGQPAALLSQGQSNPAIVVGIAMIAGFLLFGILSIYFFKSIVIASTALTGSFALMVGCYGTFKMTGLSESVLTWMDPAGRGFLLLLLFAFFGILIQHGINKVCPDPEEKAKQKEGEGGAAPPASD